ncbi:hypothetical protein SDC9_60287 [bioreactor metagenome]|uniref:Uncharacterized protein n=1 Tax=bioreactor metagenome TaxID=1076179 RepID=A0A644XDF1_9ZZZZ
MVISWLRQLADDRTDWRNDQSAVSTRRFSLFRFGAACACFECGRPRGDTSPWDKPYAAAVYRKHLRRRRRASVRILWIGRAGDSERLKLICADYFRISGYHGVYGKCDAVWSVRRSCRWPAGRADCGCVEYSKSYNRIGSLSACVCV